MKSHILEWISFVGAILFILAVCVFAIFELLSAISEHEESKSAPVSEYCNMVEIASDGSERIYVDQNTGVMYYRICQSSNNSGITVIYNTDGTPKIYEKEN